MPDIEYRFGPGPGAPHVHHSAADADVNADGTADGVALDFDGDGRVDDVLWDSDGDGIADTALLDLDDDGKAESAYHDPSGQGTWNAEGQGGGGSPAATPQPDPKPELPLPQGKNPHPPEHPDSEYAPYEDDDDPDGLFDDLLEIAGENDAEGREEWYEDLER
ncbi:hypothetical protein [Actinophytocola sp.]|uniref:hypothetical protein n=1 Tax=Actinophytocola sp. TaxID=1872138 RepID=UPI002D80BB12|nr:hypothetical protein [Actinophytocola sp.]HET9142901.1 hypothetical protein [Actinophytocola sp.]